MILSLYIAPLKLARLTECYNGELDRTSKGDLIQIRASCEVGNTSDVLRLYPVYVAFQSNHMRDAIGKMQEENEQSSSLLGQVFVTKGGFQAFPDNQFHPLRSLIERSHPSFFGELRWFKGYHSFPVCNLQYGVSGK